MGEIMSACCSMMLFKDESRHLLTWRSLAKPKRAGHEKESGGKLVANTRQLSKLLYFEVEAQKVNKLNMFV